jgi:hypothetical protein
MQRALWLLGHRRALLWDKSQGAGQEITHSASRAWIRPMAIYQRRRQQAALDYSHCQVCYERLGCQDSDLAVRACLDVDLQPLGSAEEHHSNEEAKYPLRHPL